VLEKVNAIAHCLENLFTPNAQRDETHEWRVYAGVQAVLEAVDNNAPKNYGSVTSKSWETYNFPNECLVSAVPFSAALERRWDNK